MKRQTHQQLQDQITPLVAGELPPIAAWKLRRHLSGCAACRQELDEVQALWADLGALRAVSLSRTAPAWPARDERPAPATITLGGLIMKRRAVLATTAALMLATVTGAVAARKWLDFTPHAAFTDSRGQTWEVRTKLPGTIRLYNTEGVQVGQMASDGGFPRGSNLVLITYAGRLNCSVQGYGRHLLRSENGALLGSAEVSRFTPEQKQERRIKDRAARHGLEALYREPNVFTSESSGSGGLGGVTGSAGLAAGYLQEKGVSWKMLGYAAVSAEYLEGGKPERQAGQGSALPAADLIPPTFREEFSRLLPYVPRPGALPQISWQMAAKDHTIANGTWRDLHRSGTFTGYGRHVVKDESGKAVLVLTVSPLTPPAAAR